MHVHYDVAVKYRLQTVTCLFCVNSTGNACYSDPCQSNAVCINHENSYECRCTEYFDGTSCETDINECLDANFCNNGQCTNTFGGYNCACPPTSQGERCFDDVRECDVTPSPCLNGATCVELQYDYSCECTAGYSGRHCQTQVGKLNQFGFGTT